MATEYTITYTFQSQDNTSGNRSVAFNRFTASGDTDRTIGQITSIRYEHWHTSTNPMNWGLRGRLTLADGTVFLSDQVYNHISGNVVKYVNSFTTLPTARQFADLMSIQTLDTQGKSTSGGYAARLYWRASAAYPMRLIVTFLEEPPVFHGPEVTSFLLTRCNSSGKPDDEGTLVTASLDLSLLTEVPDDATLHIYYAANAYPVVGAAAYIDLTARIPELILGLSDDPALIPGEWGADKSWYFAAVFTAGEEAAVATASISRAKGSLHVSGQSGGGVCICGYSGGTSEKPLFESYAPGCFYEGIRGVSNYESDEIPTGGRWIDGRRIYRRVLEIEVTSLGVRVDCASDLPATAVLVNLHGYVTRPESGAARYPVTFWYSASNYHSIWMETPQVLSVKTSHPIRGCIVIEYTKSTEEVIP